jgi:hypothetical protein
VQDLAAWAGSADLVLLTMLPGVADCRAGLLTGGQSLIGGGRTEGYDDVMPQPGRRAHPASGKPGPTRDALDAAHGEITFATLRRHGATGVAVSELGGAPLLRLFTRTETGGGTRRRRLLKSGAAG